MGIVLLMCCGLKEIVVHGSLLLMARRQPFRDFKKAGTSSGALYSSPCPI